MLLHHENTYLLHSSDLPRLRAKCLRECIPTVPECYSHLCNRHHPRDIHLQEKDSIINSVYLHNILYHRYSPDHLLLLRCLLINSFTFTNLLSPTLLSVTEDRTNTVQETA